MFKALEIELDSYLKMGVPGYDCAVYKDGKCVYRRQNGYENIETGNMVKGNELYNMYSCSKPITCTAALQLVEQAKLSLDDKLSDYLPEFEKMKVRTSDGLVDAKSPILIRHLFEMSAGFSYRVNTEWVNKLKTDTNGLCPTREAMKYLATEPLYFHPGESWMYSLCHDVLAAVVEVITKQRYSDYVKSHIFDVLGMNNSTFWIPENERYKVAQKYAFDEKNRVALPVENDIGALKLGTMYEAGGAGLISTVDDYILFLEELVRGEKILKRETVELMAKNRLDENQLKAYWYYANLGYGYGLGVRCPLANEKRDDFGWDGAAGSYLAVDIKNQITIFMSHHVMGPPDAIAHFNIYDIVRKILVD